MDKEKWMNLALEEAHRAKELGEVPVGAVVVSAQGELIAQAHNLKEQNNDPCGHAEIIVLQKTAEKLGSWRLSGCWLFVTLEPCMMCTGAIVHSRIDHLVFGATDPKSGFVISKAKGFEDFDLNHHPTYTSGVYEEKCSTVLKNFFKLRRHDKRNSQ